MCSGVSETRISLIYQLAQRHCMARLNCRHCDHFVVVSAAIMERMFGPMENLNNVQRRMRCTRCSGKGGSVVVIRPPSR